MHPVIGQLDDLLIVGVATWWFLRACPPELLLVGLEELEATPLTRLQRMAPWLVAALLALGTAVALWVVFFR